MKRKLQIVAAVLLSALLLAPPVYAQRETEVMVVEFVLDQVSVTGASAEIRNAGQTQHSIFVRLEHAPTLTCTDAGLSVQIEQGVSFQDDPDTVSWQLFGLPVTDTDYGAIGSVWRQNTSGATRNLRVNATGFDTVNCLLSVTYVGSTRPVPLFDIGGDSLEVIAEIYNFITVNNNPVCSLVDTFIFFNGPAGQLRICHNAVITDIGGGGAGEGTRIDLPLTSAVVTDGSASNAPTLLNVRKTALTGIEGFALAGRSLQFQHIQWTFPIPSNFSSAPILHVWFIPSTSIGAWSATARVRCLTPGTASNWNTSSPWDADNTDAAITGTADALERLDLPLVFNDSMAPGMLCQLDLEQDSAGFSIDFMMANITYTGA